MADREKVIKGMEQFRADLKPFCGNHADWERFDDGLSMLKEQEARVLTIEEALVDNNNSIEISPYVFVEIKGRNDIFIGSVHDDIYGDYHSNDIKVRVYRIWMSDSKTYPKADYMKTVRFWNRKPTDEQRQEVKWE